ncbi:MAG: DUF885 family protein, partial [Candidatus Angelobacter sp.]
MSSKFVSVAAAIALMIGGAAYVSVPAAQPDSTAPHAAGSDADGQKNAGPVDQQWLALVDNYFNQQFELSPTWATSVGLHEYDTKMPDMSEQGIQRENDLVREYRAKIEQIDPKALNRVNRADRELLLGHVQAVLLRNKTIRYWQRDPDLYSSKVTAAVFDLIKRNYAPLSERLQSVIARERLIPATLQVGEQNLIPAQIPQIYADIALEQLPGAISFFRNSVPEAFK